MFRKIALAAIAAASLGTAALAPTAASAGWGWHHHGGYHHHHHGWRRYAWGPRFFAGAPGGCYVRRLVPTSFGPRWRVINRCF